jgi:hypothetical protein
MKRAAGAPHWGRDPRSSAPNTSARKSGAQRRGHVEREFTWREEAVTDACLVLHRLGPSKHLSMPVWLKTRVFVSH